MIANLGLRIERLLYFGFILILFCWLELYLVLASVYFSDPRNQSLDILINAMEANLPELESSFESLPNIKPRSERDLAVLSMRKELGLSPQVITKNDTGSYHNKLREIFANLYINQHVPEELGMKLDSTKPPLYLIKELKDLQVANQKKSANILGIETPRLLSFQYGSSDFKIPPQLLATVLLMAVQSLAMIWIGSFYITRQRELLIIRKLDDFQLAFPHILNWFSMDFTNFYTRIGFVKSRKKNKFDTVSPMIFTTLFRCVIALLLMILIIFPITYSTIMLSTISSTSMFIIVISSIFVFINTVLSFMVLVQETFNLKGKVFYE